MWNGRFGCKKRRDLDKDDKGIEYLMGMGFLWGWGQIEEIVMVGVLRLGLRDI